MPTNTIQLIIFDLGGVLIRLCDGWDHACELAGVTPTKSLTDDVKDEVIKLVHLEEVGALSKDEFFERSAPHLGLTPEEAKAMSDAWLCGAYPGIDDLIDTLHTAGFQTACLSNTNANHWQAMTTPDHPNNLPLEKLHHRFASHLVRDRKPNLSIYQHVEQATGQPPEAILFFDDAPENIEAAKARGWHAMQVTDQNDPASQMTSHLKMHNLI